MAGGGAVYSDSTNIVIENSVISDNHADSVGGGISVILSDIQLINVLIIDNSVTPDGSGGGVSVLLYTNIEMNNVIIQGNSAFSGGGMKTTYYCNLNLYNVEISGNHAVEYFGGGYGGGIYHGGHSVLNCDQVTIANNIADGHGDGILIAGINSEVNLNNSIVWNYESDNIYFYYDYLNSHDNNITINYSNIQGGESGIETNNAGTVTWLDGNIDEDPLFVDPENGNYHLQLESPSIDAGDPDSPPDPDGTLTDMGAYYYQEIICPVEGDVNQDSILDVSDIVITVSCILDNLDECECSDMNSDDIVDVLDIVTMVGLILGIE